MKNTVSNICLNCQSETANPKFCNRSCSATYNNTIMPKRRRQSWRCPMCDKANRKSSAKGFGGCVSCWIKLEDERIGQMTLGQSLNLKGHPKSRYNTVRYHGRKLSSLYDRCQVCSYSTIVQVCHIKPIHTFSLDTLISVINDPSNVAILCPNHHLELDRGFIVAEDIPARIT